MSTRSPQKSEVLDEKGGEGEGEGAGLDEEGRGPGESKVRSAQDELEINKLDKVEGE